MKIIKVKEKLTQYEKETNLNYDSEEKVWKMDTTILKHYNKAKKQGWEQTAVYLYEDGSVCGGVFKAPGRAITIRRPEQKKVSEKQINNLK